MKGTPVLLALALAVPAAAQTPAPPAPAPIPPMPAPSVSAQAQGTAVDLKIEEAVARALERNLDIAVERLNPTTFDFSIAALKAVYRPALTSALGYRDQTQFSRSQTAGGDVLITETATANAGLAQNLRWGGGSYSVDVRQHPDLSVRPVRDAESLVERQHQRRVRAADPARLQDRHDADPASRDGDQPGDFRDSARHDHQQHAGERAECGTWDLLFAQSAVRVAQSSLGARRKADHGQQGASGDRDDGADRRRPVRGGGGGTPPDARDGRGDVADGGVRAQAADRIGHERSPVVGPDQSS